MLTACGGDSESSSAGCEVSSPSKFRVIQETSNDIFDDHTYKSTYIFKYNENNLLKKSELYSPVTNTEDLGSPISNTVYEYYPNGYLKQTKTSDSKPKSVLTSKTIYKNDKLDSITTTRDNPDQYGWNHSSLIKILAWHGCIPSTIKSEHYSKKGKSSNTSTEIYSKYFDSENRVIRTDSVYKAGVNLEPTHTIMDIYYSQEKFSFSDVNMGTQGKRIQTMLGTINPSYKKLIITNLASKENDTLNYKTLLHKDEQGVITSVTIKVIRKSSNGESFIRKLTTNYEYEYLKGN